MDLWDNLVHSWTTLILILILIVVAYAIGFVMSSLNLTGSAVSYAMNIKISYGWINANYIYIFFEVMIGGIAIYGLLRLIAALRSEK